MILEVLENSLRLMILEGISYKLLQHLKISADFLLVKFMVLPRFQ